MHGGAVITSSTMSVDASDPTPSVDSVLYSVDTANSGTVTLTVSSPRAYDAAVSYSKSVNGGAVQIDDNVITATTLDYTQNFTINIAGICSGVQKNTLFNGTFNIRSERAKYFI